MANLAFSDLQTETYQQVNLDSTDTTTQNNVTRWLNYTQQDVCSRWPWPFMESRESIVTVPDYTTGTVSINAGSQTVTGSSTVFTSTMANGQYWIQFIASNDWYLITAFNSATSLTVEQPYQGTTNLTASTYIIRKKYYSLSSSCDRVVDILNMATPLKLIQVDPRTIDDLRPNPQSTNAPYGYLMWGVDTSGNVQVVPYPYPSDARVFELKTIKKPTDSAISIPNKYAHILAWGAISIAWAYKKDLDMAQAWSQKFEQRLAQMRSEYRMSEDNQIIMRSIDSIQRAKWIQMPEQYPTVISG
jgi:hypothetical protein